MKDVIDALNSRIKTPYFGYAILAFLALNWRGFFLLLTTTGSPQDRLAAFDSVTSLYSLIMIPLFAGMIAAASAHWIQYCFGLISKKPLGLLDNLGLEAEHNKTLRQAELERSRSDLFAVKEKELIDRAKRDEEVAGIENDEAKAELALQLETLRRERDQLSAQLKNNTNTGSATAYSVSKEAGNLIRAAAKDKNGLLMRSRAIGRSGIQAGSMMFGDGGARNYALYDSALDELSKNSLIKKMSDDMYQLTAIGWQVADAYLGTKAVP